MLELNFRVLKMIFSCFEGLYFKSFLDHRIVATILQNCQWLEASVLDKVSGNGWRLMKSFFFLNIICWVFRFEIERNLEDKIKFFFKCNQWTEGCGKVYDKGRNHERENAVLVNLVHKNWIFDKVILDV